MSAPSLPRPRPPKKRPSDVGQAGRQVIARLLDPSRVSFHVHFQDGVKRPVRAVRRLEIWTPDHHLVGQLSGDAVEAIVIHHLATAALGAAAIDEFQRLRSPRRFDPLSEETAHPGPTLPPETPGDRKLREGSGSEAGGARRAAEVWG